MNLIEELEKFIKQTQEARESKLAQAVKMILRRKFESLKATSLRRVGQKLTGD